MTDLLLCDRWKLQLKHASAAKKVTNKRMKEKNSLKNVTRCRDSRSAKAEKQGRDDSSSI